MQKINLLFILTLFCHVGNAQNKIVIHQPYKGRVVYPIGTTEINALTELPSKHQFIIKTVISKSMTDFQKNIVFIKGQKIDITNWLTIDSVPQTQYEYVIPSYQLFFELRDTSLGIIKYAFELSLDQYGQVVKFDWPRNYYNQKAKFIQTNQVLEYAINFAKNKGYDTDVQQYSLQYNKHNKTLCWLIGFMQPSKEDEKNGFRRYKTIAIDARRLEVVEETEWLEGYPHSRIY